MRDQAELHKILSVVLDLLDPQRWGFRYRLVGTGAALAQGVRLPTGDIDLLVAERSDVDRFATALSGFPCQEPPTWLPGARQYFTHFKIDEIDVGASTVEVPTEAEAIECIGTGPWLHYVDVKVGKHVVPAVALELRLVSELIRDRPGRYTALIEHMRSYGADLELVQQAMRDRQLHSELQRHILNQLRPN